MPNVLTTSSTITCPHSGSVNVMGEEKLKIKGSKGLIKSGIEMKDINGCLNENSTSPPITKCSRVQMGTSGEATKLKVRGNPVILDTLTGMTDGKVSGVVQSLLSANANQSKLTST